MPTSFQAFSRTSLCLTFALLTACGGSATKPEWSQVVYTDTPILMEDPTGNLLPAYRYPVVQSVMKNVLTHTTGYGISLFPERADYLDDSVFSTLNLTGQIVDSKAVLPFEEELHPSVSGRWIQDAHGRVTAINAEGILQWQTQIVPVAVSNSTGANADFISAFQATNFDAATQRNVRTLTLTGLGEQGEVLWQQSLSSSTENYYWVVAHDDQGKLCYVENTQNQQYLRCLNANGAIGFSQPFDDTGYKTLAVSHQRIAVISNTYSTRHIALFDRQAGLIQTSSQSHNGREELLDVEFSSDNQLHLSFFSGDALTLLTLDGNGQESLQEIAQQDIYPTNSLPLMFSPSIGKLSADALGNVYVLSESWSEVVTSDTQYRTVQSLVVRRTANSELSNVLLGHLSKFNYQNNGECTKRCTSFGGAQVLTDIAAQPDGRLLTAWANSVVGVMIGDLETSALVPYRRSITISSYAPPVSMN